MTLSTPFILKNTTFYLVNIHFLGIDESFTGSNFEVLKITGWEDRRYSLKTILPVWTSVGFLIAWNELNYPSAS